MAKSSIWDPLTLARRPESSCCQAFQVPWDPKSGRFITTWNLELGVEEWSQEGSVSRDWRAQEEGGGRSCVHLWAQSTRVQRVPPGGETEVMLLPMETGRLDGESRNCCLPWSDLSVAIYLHPEDLDLGSLWKKMALVHLREAGWAGPWPCAWACSVCFPGKFSLEDLLATMMSYWTRETIISSRRFKDNMGQGIMVHRHEGGKPGRAGRGAPGAGNLLVFNPKEA